MKTRRIILTIDSIMALLKDYCSTEDVPPNSMPVKLMVNPKEQNKLAIYAQALEWQEGLPPLQVHFDVRRVYSV